jgi:hypothetical protein
MNETETNGSANWQFEEVAIDWLRQRRTDRAHQDEFYARVEAATGVPCSGSGRIVARSGLRMMPTFPRSPLTFRKASFPRYG